MKHIMIDMETLGTTANAVILSLGAVKFDLASGTIDDAGFYASISVESNLDLGRRVQEDTLLWWFKQEAAAQQVFFEPKIDLTTALTEFSDWVATDDYQVWSNGADFDLPMLAHAYSQIQVELPWQFWNSNCFRTYKKLPGAKDALHDAFVGVKHNALADAHNQAINASKIYAALFGKKVKAKA